MPLVAERRIIEEEITLGDEIRLWNAFGYRTKNDWGRNHVWRWNKGSVTAINYRSENDWRIKHEEWWDRGKVVPSVMDHGMIKG